MKKEIMDAFDAVGMSEDCEKKIRRAMAEERRPKRIAVRYVCNVAAALAVAFVMVFTLNTEVRAAVTEWVVRYIFTESGLTVYEQTDENGDVTSVMCVDTEAPAFAALRDGRLYYTCNGEERDITDQVTEEQPFYHSYVDGYGLTHYRAVGFSGSIENFGIYEFIRRVEDGQQSWEGWEGGSGRNFLNNETGKRYAWVDIVWEELNIPWPKPGE